ncbi:MAG: NDP-sugar synthase [Acidobacteria bacterium]|nr:NDP-sugar synthase [Acidobacteriota bacterium]
MSDVSAVILAGGKGTRLRPLTVFTPKPIVPMMNRPFIAFQLEMLAAAGVGKAVLSLSYQPNKIEDAIGDGSQYRSKVSFVTEPNPLGTSGAFRYAADETSQTFVVLNGDILTDIDLAKVLEQHRSAKADATIVLVEVEDPTRYGLVETDSDGRVERFLEKPKAEDVPNLRSRNINAGIYILERSVLDLIPHGEHSSFEFNIFPTMLEKGLNFRSFLLRNGYWRDIGNPSSYLQAHMDFIAGKVGLSLPKADSQSEIATAASVDGVSLIGEGCVIKPNATVRNSVLGPGVMLEEKAVVENSVIWAHSRIAAGAAVHGSVVGRSSFIGRSSSITDGTVLGDKATIPDYSIT